MDYENLLYKTKERITTITINRPNFLNIINYKTLEELRDAFIRTKKDPETKVVLVTGKGEKVFIGGADLNELVLVDPIGGKEVSQRG